jgi:hypothetical protein
VTNAITLTNLLPDLRSSLDTFWICPIVQKLGGSGGPEDAGREPWVLSIVEKCGVDFACFESGKDGGVYVSLLRLCSHDADTINCKIDRRYQAIFQKKSICLIILSQQSPLISKSCKRVLEKGRRATLYLKKLAH